MCQEWIGIMSSADVRTVWGIPQAQFLELGAVFSTAQALLQKAESNERTPVITEQCREAFEAMEAKQRFFKNHYFLVPPLTLADLVRLGLHLPTPPSPIPRPEAQVEADMTFPGVHLVELVNIRPVGTAVIPNSRSEHGVRIYFGLSGPPNGEYRFRLEAPPEKGSDLPYSRFTRRRRERFDFEGESGSRIWFCLRYENAKGRKDGEGPFGPFLSAIIP
jgi:hypothetical protein